MSSEFYSFDELAHDRGLRWSSIASILLVIAGVALIIATIAIRSIRVDPIAIVSVSQVPASASPGDQTHIMSTAEFVSLVSANNTASLAVGTKISTYTTDLTHICNTGENNILDKENIVIAKYPHWSVVGTISSSQDVCAAVHRLASWESILVTSARPIDGKSSKPVIMTVNYVNH